jgi:hypothetical protein
MPSLRQRSVASLHIRLNISLRDVMSGSHRVLAFCRMLPHNLFAAHGI